MPQAIVVIALHIVAALSLSGLYFRRYALKRPPIGVFNLWDVALMLAGILCVPYLYLLLPTRVVAGLLGLGALGIGYATVEPLISRLWPRVLLVVIVAGADLFCRRYFGASSAPFLLVNNLLQVIVVVGVANLWAQSGMKARHCAILGGALMVYDLLFTSVLPLMSDLFLRLGELPFAPQVAWPMADGRVLAIGLGDLLLAAVFPLVMRKAYGAQAGALARKVTALALATVLLLPAVLPWLAIFPVMVVLGPLMVVQVWYWRRRITGERTTWQYRQDEPFLAFGLRQQSSLPSELVNTGAMKTHPLSQ